METCLEDFVLESIDFISVLLWFSYYDSQHLPATTAATSASTTSAAATSKASTTTTEATTAAIEATTAAIEAATARSHAGEATIAVAACARSIESPRTTSEGIPVSCAAARKIITAYAIGSAGAKTGATGATRATNASCAVAEACVPPKVA
jgi:peptidoglycan DL-endopeptidase CwlO